MSAIDRAVARHPSGSSMALHDAIRGGHAWTTIVKAGRWGYRVQLNLGVGCCEATPWRPTLAGAERVSRRFIERDTRRRVVRTST